MPHQALAGEVSPQRLGLSVVHDQRRLVQLAGRAEVEQPIAELPLERQRRVAQRTVGHRHRHTAHLVVDDLVPDQDLDGVGLRLPVDLHDDHALVVAEEVDLVDRQEDRSIDRWDPIRGQAPRRRCHPDR